MRTSILNWFPSAAVLPQADDSGAGLLNHAPYNNGWKEGEESEKLLMP